MRIHDIRSGPGLWVAILTLGTLLWVSSLVVDTHPLYATVVGLTVLVFSAFVVPRPN
jgi:hypothetical protein